MKKSLIQLLLASFVLAIVGFRTVFPLDTAQPQVTASTEIRGVWLTNVASAVLFVPWGVHRALDQLARLNFNTVYPVVWNRGYTLYPSDVAQKAFSRSQDPFLSAWRMGRDVLAEIAFQGKQHHLRIIPWFEYGFIAPLHSELARQHPDWLTQQQSGEPLMSQAETTDLPQHSAWLNPFHPEVQQFFIDMVVEVITRYDVAGIQLDDHFGLPASFGYDPYTVHLYQNEHQGRNPPADSGDPEWIRWRADKLTAFVGQLFKAIKATKPGCILSLSPNSQAFSYRNYLQDWQTWVERGWVEELVLQVYRTDPDSFQTELNQPAVQFAQQSIPVAIGIYTGSLRQPTSFQQIQEQVERVRSNGFAGVSFFYWESLWGYLAPESPRERRTDFQSLFTAPQI